MNAPRNDAVTSEVHVDIVPQAIVDDAFAFTSVPLGAHEESVSIRTITLSTGAQTLLSHNFIVDADTPLPINRIDTLVFAATSHTFCAAEGTVVTYDARNVLSFSSYTKSFAASSSPAASEVAPLLLTAHSTTERGISSYSPHTVCFLIVSVDIKVVPDVTATATSLPDASTSMFLRDAPRLVRRLLFVPQDAFVPSVIKDLPACPACGGRAQVSATVKSIYDSFAVRYQILVITHPSVTT